MLNHILGLVVNYWSLFILANLLLLGYVLVNWLKRPRALPPLDSFNVHERLARDINTSRSGSAGHRRSFLWLLPLLALLLLNLWIWRSKQGESSVPVQASGLTDVTVNQNPITIKVWDGGSVVDGDIITISLNGQPVQQKMELTASPREIQLTLQRGPNELSIFAENDGYSPPNTANLRVMNVVNGRASQEYAIWQGTKTTMKINLEN